MPAISSALRLSACALALSFVSAAAQTATAPGLPLVFEQNAGQLSPGVAFAGRTPDYALQVSPRELNFTLTGKHTPQTIRLDFTGAGQATPEGVTEAPFRSNFYSGNDSRNWHTGVRNFDRVALRHLYPGIDAEFYARNGALEHDFLLAPDADPTQLRMHLTGARSINLSSEGDILLNATEGALRLHKPVAYQLRADGTHQPVPAAFALHNADLTFTLGAYDHTRPLVIDPVITYATFVTGSAATYPSAIQTDSAGNVYVTGYTASPIASFAAASTSGNITSPSNLVTYLAKLTAASAGSQIAWVTYFGSSAASVAPNTLANQASGTRIFLGGTTSANNLPGVSASSWQSTVTGYNHGFVSAFDNSTGALANTTYVDGSTSSSGYTLVSALATAADGSVAIAGATTGAAIAVTANACSIPGTVAAISNSSLLKGFILRLGSTLSAEYYGTYVSGDNSSTTASTAINGIAMDSAGNYYIAGTTYGDFPQAGNCSTASMYSVPAGKSGQDAFAAKLVPGTSSTTLGWVYWSGGSSNDVLNGIVVDSSNNAYLYGQTQSTNVLTSYAVTSTTTGSGTPTTAIDATYPTNASSAGFLTRINSTGQALTSTYIGATPLSTTSIFSATTDAAGNVYAAGYTSSVKSAFPRNTAGTAATTVTLPSTQDTTSESVSGGTQSLRGFVLQFPQTLASVSAKAFLGSASGSYYAVGISADAQSPAHVYVAMQGAPAATDTTYTTASAAQPKPQTADGVTRSSYLAQLAFATPAASASLTNTTPTYSPSVATYVSSTNYTTETLTWVLTGAASGASSVVFNLPYSQYLQPYTLSMLTLNGAALPAGTCTLGTASTANTTPGITCVLASLANGTTATFALTDGVTSAVATAIAANSTSVAIPAQAFDAQGDGLDLTINLPIGNTPTLTLTNSISTANVNAALSATDTATPSTSVTYTFVIKNTSSIDSPNTKLTTNLASGFTSISATSSTGCDPTATSGCDVPANGTLTYTVTGKYLASQFGATTAGPYSITNSAPSVSFTPGTNTVTSTSTGSTSVSVASNSALSVVLSSSTTTFNSGFRLGDTSQYIATVTNAGVNQSGPVTVNVTLPAGFTVTSSSATTGTGAANCSASPYTSCTFTAGIAGSSGKAVFTINGKWNDTGLSTDAVAPPAAATSPTAATVQASSTSSTVTASIPLTTGVTVSSGYTAAINASSRSLPIYRSNSLAIALATTTPLSNNTTNVLNSSDTNDKVSYTFTATNTGVSVVRGAFLSIPLPSSANFTATNIATTGGVSTANQLTCNPYTAGDTKITCYTNDLKTAPTTATTTPAATTYTVTFTGTFAPATIPSGSNSTTVTQSAATLYVAAANFTGGLPSSVQVPTVTVQKVPQTLTFTSPGNVTYGVSPITLSTTSSAGLTTFTYTVTTTNNNATVSGNVLTITGIGSVTVQVSQAGDSTNAPATASVTFTVAAAPLTFTAADASRLYGAANPTFTVNISGAVNGDTFTTSASTSATSASNVGNYAIVPTASGAALSNYTVTYVNGKLSVTPAPLTVTAADASRQYGTANPTFTATATGAVNGDTFTTSASTTATITSNVGPYAITPTISGAALGNYTVTKVNGTLTITPATLTVTAANATRVYGTANPAFTVNVTGALNGDTFTTSATSNATLTSAVGSYSITPSASGTALANYTPTYIAGTLTVTQAGTSTVVVTSLPTAGTGQQFTLTATVSSLTTGTPTGTMQFFAGSTLLGSAPLVGGSTSLLTTLATTGGYTVTAVYSGDLNFTASTSAAITQVIITPDYSITASPGTLTVARGGSATATFTVTTVGGYNQPIVFSCANLPSQATCTFAPFAITPPANTTTQLTITAAASVAQNQHEPSPWSTGTRLELATLGLLLCLTRRRKRFGAVALLGLLALAATSLSGCSGSSTNGTPTGTYTVTVTASSSTSHATTLTVIVK